MKALAISVKETTQVLGLSRTTIYYLFKKGKLDVIKCGRRTLVKVDSIHRFIEGQSNDL